LTGNSSHDRRDQQLEEQEARRVHRATNSATFSIASSRHWLQLEPAEIYETHDHGFDRSHISTGHFPANRPSDHAPDRRIKRR
jgi:hypothetical protein